MKIKELREKSDVELDKMLVELQSQLQDQRFALAGRRLTRVREVREVKKRIAKILTVKTERELASKKVEMPAVKPVEAKKKATAKEQAPAETKA
ncbi:MAG: 50S ribosomal protein L29 [Patescibacteria group bacterium]